MKRRSSSKQLTGPKGSTWQSWRAARSEAIAAPARNKAAQKLNGSRPKEALDGAEHA